MAQGIGFAIPADTARTVVAQLITKGKVTRSYLGIVGLRRPLDRRFVRFYKLDKDHAVEIVSLAADGPAAAAGLRRGDIVVAMGGTAVASVDEIFHVLSDWPVGKPAGGGLSPRQGPQGDLGHAARSLLGGSVASFCRLRPRPRL